MSDLTLLVASLRYSSWSVRAWLALTQAGAKFTTELLPLKTSPDWKEQLLARSPTGKVPALIVDGTPIPEVLAICEWAAETYPQAKLWPEDRTQRALARAASSEMATGFSAIRNELSCHDRARVPGYQVSATTQREIERVFALWDDCLQRSGGPFLFGSFGIADCMYVPMASRFRTYDVALPKHAAAYCTALWAHPTVERWQELAREAPAIPEYDEYVRKLGGTV